MLPFIEIFDEKVPSYLIIISFTYCLAIFYILHRSRKIDAQANFYLDSTLVVMISGFLGSRLLHVFYEEPAYYLNDWFRIFEIWRGGFVFYGGAITSFFAVKYFAKKRGVNFYEVLDIYAPVIIGCYILGRFSCLLAGCCHGAQCDLPWAIEYPRGVEAPFGKALHPTPVYAMIWATAHWLFLSFIEKKKILVKKTGDLFFIAMIIHSIGRLMMEFFRDDHRGAQILSLSISSWISILVLTSGIIFYRKKK